MIIQRIIKGIPDIDDDDVDKILEMGIICNWWRNVCILPTPDVQDRLDDDHLDWHQNRYEEEHPDYNNEPFKEHTPFISTTAGTVEQDTANNTHHYFPAWYEALRFATNFGKTSGWLFHGYVFVLGKKSVELCQFAEELRDLHVYSGFSPYHPEGEITAKVIIPSAQIEHAEFYNLQNVTQDLNNGERPQAAKKLSNPAYQPPEQYVNLCGLLD